MQYRCKYCGKIVAENATLCKSCGSSNPAVSVEEYRKIREKIGGKIETK